MLDSPSAPLTLVENDKALPLVNASVNLALGSLQDPEGKEGLARLLARLMRRTAAGLSAEQVDESLDAMGAAFGASAGSAGVAFSGAVIARSLGSFLRIFEDALVRPSLDEAELQRLVRETRAELIELLDNDSALARRWFRRQLFQGHPYGRSATGTLQSLEAITHADVQRAHALAINRQGALFSFAGDISTGQALASADAIARQLPEGTGPSASLSDPVIAAGRRLLFVDKPERTQTQILIGGLGAHPSDSDYDALSVANTVFGGTFTARLSQEVRSKRGWSYGAYSNISYEKRRKAFSMWTFPKAQDAPDCIRLELDLLAAWREHGITEAELEAAKSYLIRSHAFTIDTSAKRVGLLAEEYLYGLPAGYYAGYLDRVASVDLEQANTAIKRRISTDRLLVVVVGTEAQIGARVRAAIEGLTHAEVVAYDAP